MKKLTTLILFMTCSLSCAFAQSQWQWAQELGTSSTATSLSVGNGIAYSGSDGTVVTTGTFNGTGSGFVCNNLSSASSGSSDDIFIVKSSASNGGCFVGNPVSVKAGGPKDDRGNAVTVSSSQLSSGDIFVVGRSYHSTSTFFGTLPFISPSITPSTLSYDWFIAKYSDALVPQWVKGYGNIQGDDEALAVTFDNNNEYVYVGGYERNAKGFIAKIDPSGNQSGNWYAYLDRIPGSGQSHEAFVTGVTVDPNGDVIACGYFKGTMQIFNGSSTNNANGTLASFVYLVNGNTQGNQIVSNGNSYDYFVIKYRADGTFLWVATGGGSGDDRASGITTNENGTGSGVYVTGTFDSPQIVFNASSQFVPVNNLSSNGFGNKDIFICTYGTGPVYIPNGDIVFRNVFGTTGDEISNSVTYRYEGTPNSSFTGPVITGVVKSSSTSLFDPTCTDVITPFNIFVCKLDQKCSPVDSWWYNIVHADNGISTTSNAIATDRLGYFYIAGGYNNINSNPYKFSNQFAGLSSVPSPGRHAFNAQIQSLAHAGPDATVSAPIGTPAVVTSPSNQYQWNGITCPSTLLNSTLAQPGSYGTGHYMLLVQGICTNDNYAYAGGYEFDEVIIGTPNCRVANPNQITEEVSGNISVQPNPNNGVFAINTGTDETIRDISVYDLSGRMVYKPELNNVPANLLSIQMPENLTGIFMLKITTDKQKYNSKIVIQE